MSEDRDRQAAPAARLLLELSRVKGRSLKGGSLHIHYREDKICAPMQRSLCQLASILAERVNRTELRLADSRQL